MMDQREELAMEWLAAALKRRGNYKSIRRKPDGHVEIVSLAEVLEATQAKALESGGEVL